MHVSEVATAQIALQHDRVAIDRAAAAERLLELATPAIELRAAQPEFLDDGHFFATSLFALEPHDCTRGPLRDRCDGRWGVTGGELIAQLLERGTKRRAR